MGRKKSEWDSIREGMLGASENERSVEERENVPEKACGKCNHYFQAGLGTTSGMCNMLKQGDTPVPVGFNQDAKDCASYDEMKIIDTDISHSLDPKVSRHQRQMQK